MKKMGWKEGQGLGRDEDGITTALSVKSDSRGGGVIVGGDRKQLTSVSVSRSPTRVVLLTNMVGRGQVDSDLEEETGQECEKFGKVVRCVIRESSGAPDEEAVRIFVEFKEQSSAERAVSDLNGRFFAGRKVRASYYDERLFEVDYPPHGR
jgi:splicing factor 45